MRNRYLAVLWLTILAIFVMGCNHGSAVTPANIGQIGRASPHIGDKATYTIDINASNPLGSSAKGGGRRIYTILASSNHGRTLPSYIIRTFDLQADTTQRIGIGGAKRTTVIWIGEDASGNLYRLGVSYDGKSWDVVSNPDPPLYVPSKIKVGYAWTSVANFESGNVESLLYKCVGIESMQTPLGNIEAYRLSADVSHTRSQTKSTGFVWIPRTLPIVFELRESYDAATPLGNIRTSYDLESVELAQ